MKMFSENFLNLSQQQPHFRIADLQTKFLCHEHSKKVMPSTLNGVRKKVC